jgi:transcriptional regulator with XRE-family HTH domain
LLNCNHWDDLSDSHIESQLRKWNFIVDDKGFNIGAFYRTLEAAVKLRKMNWKQVADETGVSQATLTRMAQGKRPDSPSLAVLSAWAGMNPSDFVATAFKSRETHALTQISALLHSDPHLDESGAKAVEAILTAAYERIRKP